MERTFEIDQAYKKFDLLEIADSAAIIRYPQKLSPDPVPWDDQRLLLDSRDPSFDIMPWTLDHREPESFSLNCANCPLQTDEFSAQNSVLGVDANDDPSFTAEVDLNTFDPLSDYLGYNEQNIAELSQEHDQLVAPKRISLGSNTVISPEPILDECTWRTGVTFAESILASGDDDPNCKVIDSTIKSHSPEEDFVYQEKIAISKGDALYAMILASARCAFSSGARALVEEAQ
ncbi:hypothetical protein FSARC_11235 [Fusarium sarcochroum]|uniref:Uncharacterized protein n=1 Tax=Fusarium sarcochroum TaxID=1208366 RepID=A0A8H4X0I4_9HYPO|nr:hypothetical protein FSARC_11235 [Fusarium sarcochroum]